MKPLLYPSELKYRLSFFDIETGQIKPILVTDRLIEAPNWHPDGIILLNCEGCLFEVNPVDPKLIPIPIQGLNDLNNDHGITPDGRSLIVSDSPNTGSSIIYTVPYSGGRPSQVTDASPSWWHGISPDGKTLAYTARRNGVFDIYSRPFEGGVEKKLTDDFDHTDELLCVKCYITDIIDIIPSGWPARMSRFAGFEMRLQHMAIHFSKHPQTQNDCR